MRLTKLTTRRYFIDDSHEAPFHDFREYNHFGTVCLPGTVYIYMYHERAAWHTGVFIVIVMELSRDHQNKFTFREN